MVVGLYLDSEINNPHPPTSSREVVQTWVEETQGDCGDGDGDGSWFTVKSETSELFDVKHRSEVETRYPY